MPVDLSDALEEHRRGNLEWAGGLGGDRLGAVFAVTDLVYCF